MARERERERRRVKEYTLDVVDYGGGVDDETIAMVASVAAVLFSLSSQGSVVSPVSIKPAGINPEQATRRVATHGE